MTATPPFTPEQEARIREIVDGAVAKSKTLDLRIIPGRHSLLNDLELAPRPSSKNPPHDGGSIGQ